MVLQANDVIGIFTHGSKIFRGRHRDREYERLWVTQASGAQGRTGALTPGNRNAPRPVPHNILEAEPLWWAVFLQELKCTVRARYWFQDARAAATGRSLYRQVFEAP